MFSRPTFAWEGLEPDKITVVHPSIDVFSPKNADQGHEQRLSILARTVVRHRCSGDPTFTRSDGTPGRVDRRAQMLETTPLTPADRLIVQISRWDSLKDPIEVLHGFERQIVDGESGILISNPSDLREFGAAVVRLLAEPERAQRIASPPAPGCPTTSWVRGTLDATLSWSNGCWPLASAGTPHDRPKIRPYTAADSGHQSGLAANSSGSTDVPVSRPADGARPVSSISRSSG